MYYPDNGQRSYKPQAKHADRMIYCVAVHKNTRERTFEYTGAEKDFVIVFVLLSSFSLHHSSPFQPVCLQTGKSGSFG